MSEVPIVSMIDSVTLDSIFGLLKWVYLFGIGLYILFSLVVIRQIQLMIKSLNGKLDLPLKLIGYVHAGLAVGVFVLAFIVL